MLWRCKIGNGRERKRYLLMIGGFDMHLCRPDSIPGPREMPVWGNSFHLRDAGLSPASRIKVLTEYLKSIQVK